MLDVKLIDDLVIVAFTKGGRRWEGGKGD